MNIVETQDVINIEEHGIAMNAIKTEGVWWIGAHWATADLKKKLRLPAATPRNAKLRMAQYINEEHATRNM